jgi:hypothetical protein
VVHYRLYFLDDQGRIRHPLDLDCTDDRHAIETVAGRCDGRRMELWQSGRKVGSFDGVRAVPGAES